MMKKILWKIEELWSNYYKPTETSLIDISKNYLLNGSSRYYNKFHQVDNLDFNESKKPVFVDDYGDYMGLEKCQVLEKKGKLIYLFDNHNEIIYPIVEIFESTGKKYDVVHIDAHPDDAVFLGKKNNDLNLENVQEYIIQTRISDFFDAIFETSIVGEVHRVTHSDSFEFFLPPDNPYILSLDIDIFGPEGDFVELKDKVRAIALAWNKADAVCIATSPGFIDQKYAQEIISILTNK